MAARNNATEPRPSPLDGFKISSITVPAHGDGLNCRHVASMLTSLSAHEVSSDNPAMADIGLLTFLSVFGHRLPTRWAAQPRASSSMPPTNPPPVAISIAGIGMYVANTMLALLVVLFWVFSLVHSPGAAHRKHTAGAGIGKGWRHDCSTSMLCHALRATVDDVFDGALVFSTSLHVATLSYQASADHTTRYEVTFAQTSCTFAALSVMSLWHVRAELTRSRPHTAVFFYAMCGLAVAVFVLRCLYWLYPTTFWDETCVDPTSEAWWHGRAFMDSLCAAYFAISVASTLLPVQSWATRLRPGRAGRLSRLAQKGLFTKLRIVQSFFGTFGIFFYMFVMNTARSDFEDENKWGIGQYLAVASWLPSIIKLGYFLCVPAMETALTNHLPLPWTARLPPPDGGKADPTVACQEHRLPHDGIDCTGLEEGTMTRRNTDPFATAGPDSAVLSGVLLVRRDSDVTVVGDAPEPVKLKDTKH
ncbi:hypothetical protein MAPG_04749 [Magnaporthiopsis poae ATCC 64411]|uniref:Uncharacterized protein n=1 Tax=Magnaporthiopsis poae (strain ATCC 64411 / 73-15) TaxID=644358 RepID=A0A0C4DXJ5_MAGP6|nr:hypothetical protein MAPG_04749 [Magnaporthiopsis poae ATCC 64411]